jgi:adenylylsulfate kinase-like enzyme
VIVLDEIERWARDSKTPPVFWLNGLAGTGKSTIAQTTAERMFAHGLLGASFFCSRGVEDRSNLKLIFPTLAFQLAQKYSSFRSRLIPLL